LRNVDLPCALDPSFKCKGYSWIQLLGMECAISHCRNRLMAQYEKNVRIFWFGCKTLIYNQKYFYHPYEFFQ